MITFLKGIWGMIVAIIRLGFILVIFAFTGLQHILFNKCEVSGVSLTLIPQLQDRDKIAYIDKLRCGNVDLATGIPIPDDIGIPFRDDDYFDDLDDFDDDFPDEDDGAKGGK